MTLKKIVYDELLQVRNDVKIDDRLANLSVWPSARFPGHEFLRSYFLNKLKLPKGVSRQVQISKES